MTFCLLRYPYIGGAGEDQFDGHPPVNGLPDISSEFLARQKITGYHNDLVVSLTEYLAITPGNFILSSNPVVPSHPYQASLCSCYVKLKWFPFTWRQPHMSRVCVPCFPAEHAKTPGYLPFCIQGKIQPGWLTRHIAII